MSTNTATLLTALGTHLAEFELPPIASVHVDAYPPGPPVTVQLSGCAPAAIAHGLLAWADTLTQTTAEAWRVPEGDSVHLSVTGLLPGNVAVGVYGGLRASELRIGAGLKPGATTTMPLAALRHMVTLGEVNA